MKKALFIIIALACLAGCSKEGGIVGNWSASTSDGRLFLELRSGGNGVAYFEGCSSSSAFWSADGSDIKITASALNKDFVMYRLGQGTIGGDVLRVEATITKAHSSDKTQTLTFTKQ